MVSAACLTGTDLTQMILPSRVGMTKYLRRRKVPGSNLPSAGKNDDEYIGGPEMNVLCHAKVTNAPLGGNTGGSWLLGLPGEPLQESQVSQVSA
jgi:hypothetical protein